VTGLRDYQQWHKTYDDPDSGLSWRLSVVQRYLRDALVRQPGEIQVLSLCSGDGRDIIGVLDGRKDADRVRVTLIELHPEIARQARKAAETAGLTLVEVRIADAGNTSSYLGAAPADVVLMVGIFGNISNVDLEQTIKASPQLCRPGATLLWSRGRDRDDLNDAVRAWFCEAGFVELDYDTRESGTGPALGAVSYQGVSQPLESGRQLFTFLR
jgi:SAM-dependent methyltransferase